MKCLVTGGAGFIGSHLCEALLDRGDHVIAFDDLSTGSINNLMPFFQRSNFEFIKGSILDVQHLRTSMDGCDEVYHLASVVGVSLILSRPSHGILINTIGTENVFDCVQETGCRVLFTSSSEVYGKDRTDKLHESSSRVYGSPDKLRWSYASAKAMSEFSAIARYREFGLKVVVTRLFNTVGPRQSGAYGMVLPRFIEQALQNKPITVYGSGNQSRCFTWVGDAVNAMITLSRNSGSIGEIYNVGNDTEITINDIAKLLLQISGSNSSITHINYDEAYPDGFEEIERRIPDLSKIKAAISYYPTLQLNQIIKAIISSYSTVQYTEFLS